MNSMVKNVSILEIQEKDRCSYEWDFRIPTKGRIEENIRSVPTRKYHFQNLKFKTGPLATIEHSWDLCFDTDKFQVVFSYPQSSDLALFVVGVDLRLISKTMIRSTHEFSIPEMELTVNSEPPVLEWTCAWSHKAAIEKRNSEAQPPTTSGGILGLSKLRSNSIDLTEQGDFWTDAIDTVRIAFTIEIERPGRCVVDAVYQQNGKAVEINIV